MPIIKSAIKKLRADVKKEKTNKMVKTRAGKAIRLMRKNPDEGKLSKAFSAIDRAAKGNVFHWRKADRLKARLAKLIAKE